MSITQLTRSAVYGQNGMVCSNSPLAAAAGLRVLQEGGTAFDAALEVMYIMTGGGPGRSTELLSLHIYNRAFDAQLLGYASAISVLLIVIVFALSAAILVIGNPMKEQSDV